MLWYTIMFSNNKTALLLTPSLKLICYVRKTYKIKFWSLYRHRYKKDDVTFVRQNIVRHWRGTNSIVNLLFQSPITITKRNSPYCLSVKYICRLRHNVSDKQIVLKLLILYWSETANNCQKAYNYEQKNIYLTWRLEQTSCFYFWMSIGSHCVQMLCQRRF